MFLFKKHSVLETVFCLRLQVEPTQLGPVNRASPYLRTPAPKSKSKSHCDWPSVSLGVEPHLVLMARLFDS
jgi:hypothetical protein